jgi:hypothetical protein
MVAIATRKMMKVIRPAMMPVSRILVPKLTKTPTTTPAIVDTVMYDLRFAKRFTGKSLL